MSREDPYAGIICLVVSVCAAIVLVYAMPVLARYAEWFVRNVLDRFVMHE